MALFAARRDDGRAEWKVIADHVIGLEYGAELTFADIAELLDTDDKPRAYRAIREANKHFLADRTPRALRPVRGKGYRVLAPGDYPKQALLEKAAAAKKLTGAVDLMRSAPLEAMSPGVRAWANTVSTVLVDHELRLMGVEARANFAEERIAQLERRAGIRAPTVIPGESEES